MEKYVLVHQVLLPNQKVIMNEYNVLNITDSYIEAEVAYRLPLAFVSNGSSSVQIDGSVFSLKKLVDVEAELERCKEELARLLKQRSELLATRKELNRAIVSVDEQAKCLSKKMNLLCKERRCKDVQ